MRRVDKIEKYCSCWEGVQSPRIGTHCIEEIKEEKRTTRKDQEWIVSKVGGKLSFWCHKNPKEYAWRRIKESTVSNFADERWALVKLSTEN